MTENYKADLKDLDNIVALYQIIFTKFNQEGDGIWSRLNILVALNLAFFAAFGFVWLQSEDVPNPKIILLAICVTGFGISVWTFVILDRLWAWHNRWRHNLWIIEKSFPNKNGWATPHLKKEDFSYDPQYDPYKKQLPIKFSTQPFILMFIHIWVAIFFITLVAFNVK